MAVQESWFWGHPETEPENSWPVECVTLWSLGNAAPGDGGRSCWGVHSGVTHRQIFNDISPKVAQGPREAAEVLMPDWRGPSAA